MEKWICGSLQEILKDVVKTDVLKTELKKRFTYILCNCVCVESCVSDNALLRNPDLIELHSG